MQPIFESKMFIYQSKANLEVKIVLGNIDPEIWKMLEKTLLENQDSTIHSGQ